MASPGSSGPEVGGRGSMCSNSLSNSLHADPRPHPIINTDTPHGQNQYCLDCAVLSLQNWTKYPTQKHNRKIIGEWMLMGTGLKGIASMRSEKTSDKRYTNTHESCYPRGIRRGLVEGKVHDHRSTEWGHEGAKSNDPNKYSGKLVESNLLKKKFQHIIRCLIKSVRTNENVQFWL